MKSVKVDRTKLIQALTVNQKAHGEALAAAREAYRLDMQETLVAALKALSDGKIDGIHKMVSQVRKPDDHTRDYARALAMLEMSTDEIIELTASEFLQLVQDEWQWKDDWTAMNSKYLSNS